MSDHCQQTFPCMVNIFVLANLEPACEACAPNIPEMRRMHGWERLGGYFVSKLLTARQQKMIDDRIRMAGRTES